MTSTVTIGVTIDIPEPLAGQVAQARRDSGDPLAETVRPHVTLLPPTPVDSSDLVPVLDHLYRVFSRTTPFHVLLRGTATFRPKTPVVYVPLLEGGRSCAKLAAAVRSGPLDVELTYPYYPHVTVAHNVSDEALDAAAEALADVDFGFLVSHVRLDVQRSDGSWSPHTTFEFSASAGARRGPRRGLGGRLGRR